MSFKRLLSIAGCLVLGLAILVITVLPAQAQAPANDNFADATLISSMPYDDNLNVYDATLEPGEPIQDCWINSPYPSDQQDPTVWYVYTPQVSGLIRGSLERNFSAGLAVYTGTGLNNLSPIGCWTWLNEFSFNVQAGETYYMQFGGLYGYAGWMHLYLDFIQPPPNDNFNAAIDISLGYSNLLNLELASLEPGEPLPTCVEYPERTAWYRYTPETNGFVAADPNNYWYFVAAYTGSNLGYLTEVGCRYYGSPLPIAVEAGTSYYFQVGSWAWRPGEINFNFYEAPPPTADFYWWPWEPSIYDSASFCDMSEDWLYIGYSEFWWDFGDGVIITGDCVSHQFPTDGDFTVYHNAQTIDGRTDPDGVTHTVSVRTHDVAAVRIAAPKSASAGQTRTITVYLKNNRYPEQADIQVYKTVPGGYEWVNAITQVVPVRSGNRTTPVAFLYTFTQGDADIGKVSFKAIVYLLEANDALPADNEAISPPTKVQ